MKKTDNKTKAVKIAKKENSILRIELLRDRHIGGNSLKKGDIIELPKKDAKILLSQTRGMFKLV